MKISVIIPCYNEEANISLTVREVHDFFRPLGSFEIICVNDGSKDKTWSVLSELKIKYPELVVINLMSNFGQSAAYQAGIDHSSGDRVLFISADLETEVKNFETLLKHLDEGYDFVNTNRTNRWTKNPQSAESFSLKNIKSSAANKLIEKISGVHVQDRGSGMKGMTSTIAKNLKFYTEMHRFIPDYAHALGARIVEFEVPFQDRQHGVSAYVGQSRTMKVILDLMTLAFMLNFARKPFKAAPGRILGLSGLIMFLLGSSCMAYLVVLKVLGHEIGQRPLLAISAILIILGFQSITIGLVGELITRIYFESSGRKTYMVRNIIVN